MYTKVNTNKKGVSVVYTEPGGDIADRQIECA